MWRRVACSRAGHTRHVVPLPALCTHTSPIPHTHLPSRTGTLCNARRWCASMPNIQEVQQACAVLGVSTSTPYADVKKRYLDLAKRHHPDVAERNTPHDHNISRPRTSSSGHDNAHNNGNNSNNEDIMVRINNAYSTVRSFFKSGKSMPQMNNHNTSGASYDRDGMGEGNRRYAGARASHAAHATSHTSSGGMYDAEFDSYQPWHEEVHPLMYEMMWEEMRQAGAYPESPAGGSFRCADGEQEEDCEYDEDDEDDEDDEEGGGFVYVPWRRGAPVYHSNLGDGYYYAPSDYIRAAAYARHASASPHNPYARPNHDKQRRRSAHSHKYNKRNNNNNTNNNITNNDQKSANAPNDDNSAKSDTKRFDAARASDKKDNHRESPNNTSSSSSSASSSSTWSEVDTQALIHMYRQGKSFDFIAHALSKDTALVMKHFNEWSRRTRHGDYARVPHRRDRHAPRYAHAGRHRSRRHNSPHSRGDDDDDTDELRSAELDDEDNNTADEDEIDDDVYETLSHEEAEAMLNEKYGGGLDPYGYSVGHEDFLDYGHRKKGSGNRASAYGHAFAHAHNRASTSPHRSQRRDGFVHYHGNNNNNGKHNKYNRYSHHGDGRHNVRHDGYSGSTQRRKEMNSSPHRHGFHGRASCGASDRHAQHVPQQNGTSRAHTSHSNKSKQPH